MIPNKICIDLSELSTYMTMGAFTRMLFKKLEIYLNMEGKVTNQRLVTDNEGNPTIDIPEEFIDRFKILKSLGMSDVDILYPYIEEQIEKGNYHES